MIDRKKDANNRFPIFLLFLHLFLQNQLLSERRPINTKQIHENILKSIHIYSP